MVEGELPWPSLQGFWGLGLGLRRKECVCVCERENVYVTECVCVFPMTTIPCVCMHVFVKKKKMEKNLKNKCFICFKGTCEQASRSGGCAVGIQL